MADLLSGLLTQAATLAADMPAASASPALALRAGAQAELVLDGVIGWDVTAGGVRTALRALPDDAPLTIRVNSPGGMATEGFAIFNLLAQRKGVVTARIDGLAASAASYIVMAASRIEMPTASLFMIHNASLMTMGTKEDHESSAAILGKIDGLMVRIYAARTGRAPEDVAALMAAETWFDADEAMAAGFADAVIDAPVADATALSFDARQLVAGFKQPPARVAALAQTTTTPPHVAAPPKTEVHMDVQTTPGGVAATVPAIIAASATDLTQIARKAGLGLDWVEAQASAGATIQAAQSAALDAVAAVAKAAVVPSTVTITRDEGDTRRKAIAAALAYRARVPQTQAEQDMAGEMRGWSLNDFARAHVELAGGKVSSASAVTIAGAALGLRAPMAAIGMHTTSDFPLLLANTASKSLRQAYDAAPRTFTAFSRQTTLPDFKEISRVALGGAPALSLVNEAGEIQFGTIGEGAETYRVYRYGKRTAITFEAIVNDDMSGFSRVPSMFGSSASRLESDTVYGIFNSNPNMSDGAALFVAGHANIGTGVINVANLGAGRAVMRKQTAPNGDTLNIQPSYLVVPAELETLAAQFLASTTPSTPGVMNPWAGQLTLIPEPRLTSALQWYFIASPSQIDTIEYAYLAGMEGPQISSYTDEDTDGVVIKATHCFGAKAIDWRGMYRSTGA